jgi:hypothetical protein
MREAEVHLGFEPSLPPYRGGVQPTAPTDHTLSSNTSVTEVGVEPTGTRLSTSSLCQFAYPVKQVAGPGVAPGRRSV